MTMRQLALSGVRWSGLAQVIKQVLQTTITIILTRLLSPTEFGLIGMIVVFTGFITIFSELGFGAAIIQRADIDERHLSSAFWLNLVSGALLASLLFATAPLVAQFYQEPQLLLLTRVLALNFVIGSLNMVQTALLQREMQFHLLALIDVVTVVVSGVVSISMALLGFGVWSLVWNSVLSIALGVVLTWSLSGWHPRFRFDRQSLQQLWAFGGNLVGFSLLNYWTRNADNMLIGRFVGTEGLGIYTRGYTTMLFPLGQITSVLSRVMFPAFSRLQNDIARVKSGYLRTNRVIGLLTFPMVCGLFVVTRPFVLTVYGEEWAAAIPIIQLLCLVAIKQPLMATTGWIFQALGRTDLQLRWAVISSVITLVGFVLGIRWGVLGVTISYVIRGYLLHYHAIAIPGKLIDLGFVEFHRNIADTFGCALAMALVVWVTGLLLPATNPLWADLLIQIGIGALTYLLLLQLFHVPVYHEVRDLVLAQLRPRQRERGQEQSR